MCKCFCTRGNKHKMKTTSSSLCFETWCIMKTPKVLALVYLCVTSIWKHLTYNLMKARLTQCGLSF
jgi:hypothetical protein